MSASEQSDQEKTTKAKRGESEITVYQAWCKGCGICVAFCPANVLELTELGKVRVARQEDCVNCGFCERHCPDFAISVTPKNRRRRLSDQLENGELNGHR